MTEERLRRRIRWLEDRLTQEVQRRISAEMDWARLSAQCPGNYREQLLREACMRKAVRTERSR